MRPQLARVEDERVPPFDKDLAWIQFANPMDLRVAERTCGQCHADAFEHLRASLHGTTAGHLSDGYYEMGLLAERGSRYSVFPQSSAPVKGGAVETLVQPPPFQERAPRDQLSTHYTDLARKECMQCHLWSQGRAVRGRVGFDGDYRGSGCASCHVAYALDGLSASADAVAARTEPGHPLRHEMTRAPSTQTCTSCHYGDASIGLHFRGLSQLPPNAPGGPEVPGTTSEQLNRVFYLNDPALVPPDVHHEKGMHCIDCHTLGDVMGDGRLHGQMEHAVEISCAACHGTFLEPSALVTERGTPLAHLRREGERVFLRSKVDGRDHEVPQVVHVLDPLHPRHNPAAQRAMTPEHEGLECYACHAGWNANFLGFHFSRQEQLSQLDLLSGKRTPGRVTTQEKVFATWKSFYAGRNERGAIAPYLTGFSTMGSVWDEEGRLVLDQVMPVTAQGLSGMSMIHHQPHSTRPTARACVECHRTSTTWGLGSANFRLARQLAFVADERGVEIVAIDRNDFTRSAPLAKLPLPDVVDLVVAVDPLQGHAERLYVAEGGSGIHVVDVRKPAAPRRVAFVATLDPRGIELSGDQLYVADGVGGLKIFDVSEPDALRLLGRLATFDAHDVEVRWPWAYVADGPAGLVIVDVRAPIAPRLLGGLDLNGESAPENQAILVESLFQYSRPTARDDQPTDRRTRARNVCAVLDRASGLHLVDVTEPEYPEPLYPPPQEGTRASAPQGETTYRGLALLSQIDLADPQGGERTAERDYAYVLSERGRGDQRRSSITLLDITDPLRVPRRERTRIAAGYTTEQLVVADYYNPPTRRRMAFTPGSLGVYVADLSTSKEPTQVGALPGLVGAYAVAVEEFPLDRMLDESGAPQKDISHSGSRWLWRAEIERILSVPAEALGSRDPDRAVSKRPGETTRLHFASLDRDGSGLLEEQEYEQAGGASFDRDGDGRLTLRELAGVAGTLGTSGDRDDGASDGVEVADLSGASVLAALLDGTDPFLYDQDRSGDLARAEAERALFAALDLDGDEKLSRDELSRHPGALRELRYGDERARRLFEETDRNRDGRVTAREFRLQDEQWYALDADGDGSVKLVEPHFSFQRERGFVGPGSEWPSRRTDLLLLPPGIDVERLLAEFDRDADESLDQRELRTRSDLLRVLDANGDQRVERAEIVRRLARLETEGVHALADDFLGRWDMDGSGSVDPDELSEGVRLRLGLR